MCLDRDRNTLVGQDVFLFLQVSYFVLKLNDSFLFDFQDFYFLIVRSVHILQLILGFLHLFFIFPFVVQLLFVFVALLITLVRQFGMLFF